MKKILVVTLSLALVFALALPASAAIRNTIHDFQSNGAATGFGGGTEARGMCSYCHIPHSSKGDRLWPTPGEGVTDMTGIVGNLCASCHEAIVDNDNSPHTAGDVDRTDDIYNTAMVNHVLIDDGVYANNTNQNYEDSYGATEQFGQANIWPYCGTQGVENGTAVVIECSSCHNPHDDGIGVSAVTVETNSRLGYGNDYLRASMFNTATGVAFCEYCHEEKTRGGDAGNTIGTGTHPVGTTADAQDVAQADIHIESAERVALQGNYVVSDVLYDMGIGTFVQNTVAVDNGPGTHLTAYDTGGVTCQSCHLVHGAAAGRPAADHSSGNTWIAPNAVGSYSGSAGVIYLAASDDGYANILAIENDSNGGSIGYSYITEGRTSGDYNDLCIDCHETTPSVGANAYAGYTDAAAYAADTGSDSGNDAHPVNIAPDGLSESGFALSVEDPDWPSDDANWTDARWAGLANTARNFTLTANGRWDGSASPTNSRSEIVCLTCHSIHDGENGSPILRANSTYFCQDCHTAAVGTVSHPVGEGSSMNDNPDGVAWPNHDQLPLNNYYAGTGGSSFDHTDSDTDDMACYTCHAAHDGVDDFMLRISDDNSRICTGCHTDFRPLVIAAGDPAEAENPANYIAEYGESAGARLGSHYTGTIQDSAVDTAFGETRWAYTGVWTDTEGTTKQTSHWAGGSGPSGLRMQCQSCHTPHNAASGLVEANTYDGTTSPVDYDYPGETDSETNYDGTTTTRMCNTPTSALLLGNNENSKICATCHWPAGTHVTTIYTVPAKPDPARVGGSAQKKYRDYCTRNSAFIIGILHANQEEQYDVYDLLADLDSDGATPESPCNFPPLFPGVEPTNSTGVMVCDSCHAPHGAATGSGAFILEEGTGDADVTATRSNQRVANRNYQDLCWLCHDK